MKLEGWQNPSQKSKVKARSTEGAEGKEGERCIERKSDTKSTVLQLHLAAGLTGSTQQLTRKYLCQPIPVLHSLNHDSLLNKPHRVACLCVCM